jgi:hypothetical protein
LIEKFISIIPFFVSRVVYKKMRVRFHLIVLTRKRKEKEKVEEKKNTMTDCKIITKSFKQPETTTNNVIEETFHGFNFVKVNLS